jgi:hypothetical protein
MVDIQPGCDDSEEDIKRKDDGPNRWRFKVDQNGTHRNGPP